MTLDPVLQIFFDEADELLRTFEDGVLGLERAPGDRECLNSIFRAAHTLKGNSSMLGFERIATLTHALEELLVRLRGGASAPSRAVIDALLSANDVLGTLIAHARANDDSDVPGVGALIDMLADHAQSVGHVASLVASARATAPQEEAVYAIRFEPPVDLLRRGLDPLRLMDGLSSLGEVSDLVALASAVPPLETLDPEGSYFGFQCRLRTRAPRTEIEACFEFVDEPDSVHITALEGGQDAPAPARTLAAVDALPAPHEKNRWTEGETQSIRVATEKVDRLVDLVGELVITQSMVAQIVHQLGQGAAAADRLPELQEAVAQMDRHTRDLEERVMAVRMLPIKTVFSRFSRVVRDLANAQSKRVSFETRGDETELDKTVIERIGDPLLHLVRNAIDHGIEPPAERREFGKPEAGRLTLGAYQQGGNIYIEIQDDGRGLDRDRIRRKGIEVGLVNPDEALTDEQVLGLIWEPGFSTAAQVTEVSGRGVGMDVVKRNVQALGGSISTQSVAGRGTTFRIKLPLTLAILEGQSLRVGGQVYILPLATITESVRPTNETLRTVLGTREAFVMRGEVLPFMRLHRLFRVPGAVEEPTRGLSVVVEHEGRRVALFVDELLNQQQFVIKSLDSNFQPVNGVAGATILGDGRVALILDVPGLVALGKAA